MPNERLADLRTTVRDLDQAKDTMMQIALVQKRLAVAQARMDKRIADVKALFDQETEDRRLALDQLTEALANFCQANRQLFEDPRTVKTDFGEFGLRQVTDLLVANEEAAVQDVMDRGYDDCFETLNKLVKPAVRKRIQEGEQIAGCQIRTGDTVVCKVAKAVIDEGLKQVED